MIAPDSLNIYKADLHIHTVLSPCGSLEMSPVNIVHEATRKGIDIIGITDHNATHHASLIRRLAADSGIFVMMGAEVTSTEEVHCLAYFDADEILVQFQQFIDEHIQKVPNNPEKFGHQLIVDENENILSQVDWLLINATNLSIDEIEIKVHELGGIFIPAHIDRSAFSLISQLGFVPPELKADAFEISKYAKVQDMLNKFPYLKDKAFVKGSDAHFLRDIGNPYTEIKIQSPNFEEIRKAIFGLDGRMIKPVFE